MSDREPSRYSPISVIKEIDFIITFDHNLSKGKIKNRKTLAVERFFVVEMRRIELLQNCSPVNKM